MNNIRALIIEDHELQAMVVKSDLKSLGIKNIHCVHSGKEALSFIKKEKVDVIFCDLMLPEMDGIQIISSLNRNSYSSGIVVFSALGSDILSTVTLMCEKLNFTFVDTISKPAKKSDYERIIKKLEVNINNSNKLKEKYKNTIQVECDDVLLALSNGEIKNYYQPQIDFNTNRIVSVEVLARWLHPIYGLLSPAIFLPIIESSNLMNELFYVIFTNTLNDYSNGILSLPSSINLTESSLEVDAFSEWFISKCNEYKVKPSMFTMELTEKEVFNDSAILLKNISRLRTFNVGVSIDDFGTGHSSFVKLANLPFNEIKVDRGFITDCIKNKNKKTIVNISLALAKEMKMKIVAEGVEDETTWCYLKELGFDLCQGFYTGKPLPIEMLNLFIEIEGIN